MPYDDQSGMLQIPVRRRDFRDDRIFDRMDMPPSVSGSENVADQYAFFGYGGVASGGPDICVPLCDGDGRTRGGDGGVSMVLFRTVADKLAQMALSRGVVGRADGFGSRRDVAYRSSFE